MSSSRKSKKKTRGFVFSREALVFLLLLFSALAVSRSLLPKLYLSQEPLPLQGVYTVTGREDWNNILGYGKQAGEVGMKNEMMVGGSGMEGMSLKAMQKMHGGSGNDMNYGGGDLPDAEKTNAEISGEGNNQALQVTPSFASLQVGENKLRFVLKEGEVFLGRAQVTVVLGMEGMGSQSVLLREKSPGHYEGRVHLSMAGSYSAEVRVQLPKGGEVRRVFSLEVRP